MKTRILMVAVWLCMLVGCTLVPVETMNENETQIELSVDETEENLQEQEVDFSSGDLRTMFEAINNEEIQSFEYGDYNKDGQHEAFVLTRIEQSYNLWYFHPKECEAVCENIKEVESIETDSLTFPTRDYLLLQQMIDGKRYTMIYSIDNNNQVFETNISKKGYIHKTSTDEIWLQPNQEQHANMNQEGMNTYYLYYVFDEGFREYGAIPIGTEQFLEFEGAQEVLDEVSAEYPDYEIEYSFLYRLNHYINVNITLMKDGNTEYKNMTLIYDDYEVMRTSENLADGRMGIAYMLDIATFPTAFKHPRKRATQENGG